MTPTVNQDKYMKVAHWVGEARTVERPLERKSSEHTTIVRRNLILLEH